MDAEAGVGAFNEGMAVFRQGGSARASLLRGGVVQKRRIEAGRRSGGRVGWRVEGCLKRSSD